MIYATTKGTAAMQAITRRPATLATTIQAETIRMRAGAEEVRAEEQEEEEVEEEEEEEEEVEEEEEEITEAQKQ